MLILVYIIKLWSINWCAGLPPAFLVKITDDIFIIRKRALYQPSF